MATNWQEQLVKLDEYRYMIPRSYKAGMQTDVIIYVGAALLESVMKDLSLEQAANLAFLPGIVGKPIVMPDVHQGYGFPIGGVAATDGLEPSAAGNVAGGDGVFVAVAGRRGEVESAGGGLVRATPRLRPVQRPTGASRR